MHDRNMNDDAGLEVNMVSWQEIEQLPRWGLVALAARSAGREPQMLHGPSAYLARATDDHALFRRLMALDVAESAASCGRIPSPEQFEDAKSKLIALSKLGPAPFPLGVRSFSWGLRDDGPAGMALRAALAETPTEAKRIAVESIRYAGAVARLCVTKMSIQRDIVTATIAAKQQQWHDCSPVPPHAFAVFSEFDTTSTTSNQVVLEVTKNLSKEVVSYLARHPQQVSGLSPRQFEELVATVLSQLGFETELTLQTRDWGKDVVAFSQVGPVRQRFLLECKRYFDGKIDFGLVCKLNGVVHDAENAGSKGLIVTTSWLTEPAKTFVERNAVFLAKVDYERFVEWLVLADNRHSPGSVSLAALFREMS